MFCHDSRSILDNKYLAKAVKATGVLGFGYLKPSNIEDVLNMTYWYRKFASTYKLSKKIRTAIASKGFFRAIQCIKQALHCVNGLLVKKLNFIY